MRPALRANCPTAQSGTWERFGRLSHPTPGLKPQLLHSCLSGPSSHNLPFRSVIAWSFPVTRCYHLLRQNLDLSFPVMVLFPQLGSEQREKCWSGATVTWTACPDLLPTLPLMGTLVPFVGLARQPASPLRPQGRAVPRPPRSSRTGFTSPTSHSRLVPTPQSSAISD